MKSYVNLQAATGFVRVLRENVILKLSFPKIISALFLSIINEMTNREDFKRPIAAHEEKKKNYLENHVGKK